MLGNRKLSKILKGKKKSRNNESRENTGVSTRKNIELLWNIEKYSISISFMTENI